jgi:hypothetical protein
MKYVFLAMIFAATPVLAIGYGDGDFEQPAVDYLSWCDGNNVIGQDSEGQLHVLAVCSDSHLKCKATQVFRLNKSIVTAACFPK